MLWVGVGVEFMVHSTTTIALVNKVLGHRELRVFAVAFFRVIASWGSGFQVLLGHHVS